MDMGDKIEHKTDELKGRAKESAGDLTDDRDLQAEGKADRTKGKLGQAGDRVSDAVDDVKDAFRR